MTKTVGEYCRMVDISKVPQTDWIIKSGFILENLDNENYPSEKQKGVCNKIERNIHWHSSNSSNLSNKVHTVSDKTSVNESNLTPVRNKKPEIVNDTIQLASACIGLSSEEIFKNLKNTTIALHKYKDWLKDLKST